MSYQKTISWQIGKKRHKGDRVEECKKKADNDDGKSKSSKKKGCLQMAKYCINEEDFKHLAKGTR